MGIEVADHVEREVGAQRHHKVEVARRPGNPCHRESQGWGSCVDHTRCGEEAAPEPAAPRLNALEPATRR